MRAFQRPELEERLADYLDACQQQVHDGSEIPDAWKAQRRSAAMTGIADVLRWMTGKRERCMYCEDSRGTDFEHFWPKRHFPERAFHWQNMLCACTGCNRVKSDRFPRNEAGEPLLIDPTAVDPWDYLFYDPETDELTPRWDVQTGREHAKGLRTLEILTTLSHQAVAEGRGRTRRNLERAVRGYLGSPGSAKAEVDLRESIRDNDGYGLVVWFFLRAGRTEEPFSELRRRHRRTWDRMRVHVKAEISPST